MILEIKNVDQSYRLGFLMKRTQVLFDVSFSVKARSVFGLLGANGAGKTTLIKSIVGLHRPSRGDVKISGIPSFFLEAKTKIGYLPERPYFPDHLTGKDLLKYMGTLSGLTSAEIKTRSPWALDIVGMNHAADIELKRYSKGMLQRIGIAQAILHDPELLVLDEPMSGLDPIGRREIRDLMVRLRHEGKTVFFTTHIIQDAEAICDEIAHLDKGRLIAAGGIQQFTKTGKHSVEVCAENIQGKTWQALGAIRNEEIPDGQRLTFDRPEIVDGAIRKILDAGGKIISVTPIRPSLEDLYRSLR